MNNANFIQDTFWANVSVGEILALQTKFPKIVLL